VIGRAPVSEIVDFGMEVNFIQSKKPIDLAKWCEAVSILAIKYLFFNVSNYSTALIIF
jgi:hypothetical protein